MFLLYLLALGGVIERKWGKQSRNEREKKTEEEREERSGEDKVEERRGKGEGREGKKQERKKLQWLFSRDKGIAFPLPRKSRALT